ncbi:glycoside hydrolase family 27 protein [Mucilaginibacter sp.]|uniref:glycoside hydrolase family 27 protein n=1 Tax=Mucilaginibacter sp. TaxID=1882438 RepID=UPI003D0A1D90
MKYLYAFIIFSFLSAYNFSSAQNVAPTPPMGWNSYNCYGSAVHEDEVKANADYMAQNLKQYNWQYVVVDFLWSYDNPPGSNIGNPFQKRLDDGSYIPWLTMDKWGRLSPQPNKFPSAFGGKGFGPLAAYVHSLGLKFGIHVMRGIPRQAVWAKSPIKGANGITADMVADTNSKCPWMNHMYGLDMNKPGAQEYLNSILELYAGWGVDFIKVDDLSRPYSEREVAGYKKAIDNCGRPIVLSLSPGATPVKEEAHLIQNANMWRMADDFWDNWKEIIGMMNYAEQWQGKGGNGHWPDCDMIQIGKLSKRGPVGQERFSRFTEDEEYTHMTFWSIFRSPLMLGGNLPENRPFELQLFNNSEVIAVNQQGEDPRELYKKDGNVVWYSHVQGRKDIYVAMFNLNEQASDVAVSFAALGLKGKVSVRDLWKKQDIGTFKQAYHQQVNKHGAALFKLSVK